VPHAVATPRPKTSGQRRGDVAAETNRAYFRVAELTSVQRRYNAIYMDTTSTTCRSQLAVALAAKALGKSAGAACVCAGW
jgi:hypothetical protein